MNATQRTTEAVCRLLANVLGVDAARVNAETTSEHLEQWDSLKQINVILALEEEFGVTFGDEAISTLQSVAAITAEVDRLRAG